MRLDYRLDRHRPAARTLAKHTTPTRDEIARLFGEKHSPVWGVDGDKDEQPRSPVGGRAPKEGRELRKLVLSDLSSDIRVLLVKLAERFLSAQHGEPWPQARDRCGAAPRAEDLDLYAPLARWIGMEERHSASSQEMAFAELNPGTGRASVLARQDYRRVRVASGWAQIEASWSRRRRTAARRTRGSRCARKMPYSIWRKCRPRKGSFEQLATCMAFRILVADIASATRRLGLLHGATTGAAQRFKGLNIWSPRPKLAIASCTTAWIGPLGQRIEIQSSPTEEMKEDQAERGVRRALDLQAGRDVDRRAASMPGCAADDILDKAPNARSSRGTPSSRCPGQVFCFTPKGKLMSVAARRTPIDFAYAVHSQVGDHLRRLQEQRPHAAAAHPRLHNGDRSRSALERARRRRRPGSASSSPARPKARAADTFRTRQRAAYIQLAATMLDRAPRTKEGHGAPERKASTACNVRAIQAGEHRRPGRRRRRGMGGAREVLTGVYLA